MCNLQYGCVFNGHQVGGVIKHKLKIFITNNKLLAEPPKRAVKQWSKLSSEVNFVQIDEHHVKAAPNNPHPTYFF